MNYKYKRLPVVIEAFQMTKKRRWDNKDWPNWLHKAWNAPHGENALWISPDDTERELLVCGTLEGVHCITWNDYIIQGINGEIYPCKPAIFHKTYEPIGE